MADEQYDPTTDCQQSSNDQNGQGEIEIEPYRQPDLQRQVF